jgi:hypothetical protein
MPDLKMVNAHDPQVVRRVTDLLQEGRLTYVPIRNALGDVVTRLEWFRDNGVTCFPISKFDFDQHGDKLANYALYDIQFEVTDRDMVCHHWHYWLGNRDLALVFKVMFG